MFNFIIVFIFTILLICGLIKIIDLIFIYNKQIRISLFGLDFISISASLLFLLASIFFLFGVYLILNFSPFSSVAQNRETSQINISVEDCSLLLNTINATENTGNRQKNHRFIEEQAPLFTLKIDYQKGAQQLREQSRQYRNLKLHKNTEIYVDEIAQKSLEKAELFEQRINIKENEVSKQEIYKLLDRMDRVTKEKQQLIELVKRKCTQIDG